MFGRIVKLFKGAINGWVEDDASSMGASISYYAVFSIAPLLVIVIAVAGLVWGGDAVRGAVQGQLASILGTEGAAGVQKMLQSAQSVEAGVLSSIIGGIVLIIGATTVFGQLQSSLDKIWKAPDSAKPSGIWAMIRTRLLSFGVVLSLGFLLLVSLMMSAVVSAFSGWMSTSIPGAEVLLHALNITISVALETVLFALIFKFMPSVKIAWHDVWMGAVVTAVLLEIGKVAIGLYLGKSSTVNSYSAAGSIVVLLLWVYYAAQIFLFGAEFTWVYAHEHGSHKDSVQQPGTASKKHAPHAGPAQPSAAAGGAAAGGIAAEGAQARSAPAGGAPKPAPVPPEVPPVMAPPAPAPALQLVRDEPGDEVGSLGVPMATVGRIIRVAVSGVMLYRSTRAAYADNRGDADIVVMHR